MLLPFYLLKRITGDRFFHFQEECLYGIFYKSLSQKFFIYRIVSVFPLHGQFWGTQVCSNKHMLGWYVNLIIKTGLWLFLLGDNWSFKSLNLGQPKETVAVITIIYRNTKVKVRSQNGDTEYFDNVAGVLQGDTLAPYLFIICLDYVLRTSINNIRENGFELTKKRSRRYSAKTITDTDYVDDIAILANTPNQAETLLYSLEWAAAGIGLHVNAHKTENMCFNQAGDISTLEGTSLKLIDNFHQPRKQCLINRKRYRHAANEGVDSYR